MKTREKDMTMMQRLGMVTFKNTLKLFADYGVDFQLVTQEHNLSDGSGTIIYKELSRFLFSEMGINDVCEIVFVLHPKNEPVIRFYSVDDELILEHDVYNGFDIIINTVC